MDQSLDYATAPSNRGSKGLYWMILNGACSWGFAFLSIFLMARIFGKEKFGTYSILIACYNFCIEGMEMGLGPLLVRELPNHAEPPQFLCSTLIIKSSLGVFFFTVLLIVGFFITDSILFWGLVSVAFSALIGFSFQTMLSVAQSREKWHIVALLNISRQALNFLAALIIFLLAFVPIVYWPTFACINFLLAVVSFRWLLREVGLAKPDWTTIKFIFAESSFVGLSLLAGSLCNKFDLFYLTKFATDQSHSLFSGAYTLYFYALGIVTIWIISLFPLTAKTNDDKHFSVLKESANFFLTLSYLGFLLWFFFGEEIGSLVFGNSFVGISSLMKIFCIILPFQAIDMFLDCLFILKKKTTRWLTIALLQLTINVLGNLWAIPTFGIWGPLAVRGATEGFGIIIKLFSLKYLFSSRSFLYWIKDPIECGLIALLIYGLISLTIPISPIIAKMLFCTAVILILLRLNNRYSNLTFALKESPSS